MYKPTAVVHNNVGYNHTAELITESKSQLEHNANYGDVNSLP